MAKHLIELTTRDLMCLESLLKGRSLLRAKVAYAMGAAEGVAQREFERLQKTISEALYEEK